MRKQKTSVTIIMAATIAVMSAASAHAFLPGIDAGIGAHWGFDFSLSMDNTEARGEPVTFRGLGLDLELPLISNDSAFMRVHRTNWSRNAINFGGKVFIGVPKWVVFEASLNFGLWQYDGVVDILDVPATVAADGTLTYTPQRLGVDDVNLDYYSLSGTPYAKLHLDFTLRRQLLSLVIINFDGGLGVSAHFATPLISATLIEDALSGDQLGNLISNPTTASAEAGKAIVKEIIDQAMGRPAMSAHVLLGMRAKLPAIPIGLYIDTKFMIPFGEFDEDVDSKRSVNGMGILINAGLSLSI